MPLVLVFGITLLAAVLVSGLAHRSILSTAILFLAVGVIVGPGALGAVNVRATDPLVIGLAEVALFAVLFSDGMQADLRRLRSSWKLPARALLVGMPLTAAGIALLAWGLAGVDWTQALLVGAVLAPTDPVFAEAIVGRRDVPERLRHLLNVESGLNDGLALPAVLVLISVAGGGHRSLAKIGVELVLGVVIGVGVPWIALNIEKVSSLRAFGRYQPLNAVAIGVLVFGICGVTGANEFLGAFCAGSTVATVSPQARQSFESFGQLVAELLKLAAVLVFAALLTPRLLGHLSGLDYLFAVLCLVLVRPVALIASLAGGGIDTRERNAAAWFGPKGFASVTFGLLVLQSGAPRADLLFALVAVVIAISIVAHSTTDVLVARRFAEERDGGAGEHARGGPGTPPRGPPPTGARE